MDPPQPHGALWGLTLLPPTLLLAALCARCRRPRGAGAQVDNYYKPPPCVPPTRFVVISPARGPSQPLPHAQPPPWGPPAEPVLQLPSPQPPPSRRVSMDAAPPTPPEADDDYSNEPYVTGYVEVLPEPPRDGPHAGLDVSLAAAPGGEEYENVPEGARGSLGDSLEYINLPPGGSGARDASESDDNGADYENL